MAFHPPWAVTTITLQMISWLINLGSIWTSDGGINRKSACMVIPKHMRQAMVRRRDLIRPRLVLGIGEASFDQLVSVEPASASNLALPPLISSCVNKQSNRSWSIILEMTLGGKLHEGLHVRLILFVSREIVDPSPEMVKKQLAEGCQFKRGM